VVPYLSTSWKSSLWWTNIGGLFYIGGLYYYSGLYFYGGLISIGCLYPCDAICHINGVLSITNTNISNNGGATDGINNNNCVTNIYVICLCYQYALHSALSVIIMYVIYVLIIMFIINYNNHSTINAILHDSSVHIYQLVQSLFVLMNYIATRQSTTANNHQHVLWYIYVVCATLQSSLQSTSSWLVFLIYLITCNDESLICLINLGFSGANHIWQPSNVIQQAFSFICNQQTINLQSLVAVRTAICSIVYFKLICVELDVICCYFNIYKSQGETLHVEERIRCQLDFNFYKMFYKYKYLKCSSYRPWIELAPH